MKQVVMNLSQRRYAVDKPKSTTRFVSPKSTVKLKKSGMYVFHQLCHRYSEKMY